MKSIRQNLTAAVVAVPCSWPCPAVVSNRAAGRLATVARAEPRRTVRGNGAAEGLAGWRPAARLADDRRRRGLFVVCDLARAGSTRSARAAAPSTSWPSTRPAASDCGKRRTARRFSNDRGDGPRATPTIEGDRVYAFGASGDLERARCGERQGALDGQRPQAVPRLEHPVGPERIAARARGSDSRERRRDDRRAQEDRRQRDLAESRRRGRLLVRGPPPGRQRHRGDFLHESARHGRRCEHRQTAVELRSGGQPGREHRDADGARQPGVRVVRLRHRVGAAGAHGVRATTSPRKRCTSPAR